MRPENVLPITACLKGIGRALTYYPNIANAIDSVNAAIFLSQFMYWDGKQMDPDGWIFKRQHEIQAETGLTRHEQETARKRLRILEVLEEKKAGSPRKLYYRFNWDKLDEHVSTAIQLQKLPPEKKVKPAKVTPPPAQEKKDEHEPILYSMRSVFLSHHNAEYPSGYEWQPRDWKHIKDMKGILGRRCDVIKRREAEKADSKDPVVVTDDDILANWDIMLRSLTPYHKERSFTPGGLVSNFNKIIQDIINERKKQAGASTNTKARSTAADYM